MAKHRKERAALAATHIFRAMAQAWYKDDPDRMGAPVSTDGKKIYVNSLCPNVRRLAKNIAKAAGFRGKIIFSKH